MELFLQDAALDLETEELAIYARLVLHQSDDRLRDRSSTSVDSSRKSKNHPIQIFGEKAFSVWTPIIKVENARSFEVTKSLGKTNAVLTVQENGNFTLEQDVKIVIPVSGLKQTLSLYRTFESYLDFTPYGYKAEEVTFSWRTESAISVSPAFDLPNGMKFGQPEQKNIIRSLSTGNHSAVEVMLPITKPIW